MNQPKQLLTDHLVPTESLHAVYEGAIIEDTSRVHLAIGVTDRRLLGCSETGEFLDVKQEYITGIRSSLQSTPAYRGTDDRVVVGIGCAIAAVAFVGLVLAAVRLQSVGTAAIGLSIAVIAGSSAVELARRRYEPAASLGSTRSRTGDRERSSGLRFDLDRDFVRDLDRDFASDHNRLLLGGLAGGVVAVVAFGRLVLSSGGVVAPLLVLVTLGGLAVAGYGAGLDNEFHGVEFTAHHEKVVEITTVDGRTLELRTEPTADLERELGCRSTQRQHVSLEGQYETT